MSADLFSVVIRLIILFVLTLATDISLRDKHYAVSFFTFTLWLAYFRLGVYRAIQAGVGLFSKESITLKSQLSDLIFSSNFSNVLDILVLISSIILVRWCITEYRKYNNLKKVGDENYYD